MAQQGSVVVTEPDCLSSNPYGEKKGPAGLPLISTSAP